jgi:ABC-type glycerol-3-phosphate transport system substrate-binding protein
VAAGAGCASDKPKGTAKTKAGAQQERTLRIAQWSHPVPTYDKWFDGEYTQRWGEEHDIEVVVDHIAFAELRDRAAAEVAAQRGHDLLAFLAPPSAFEDDVIDLRGTVEEVEAKLGPMTPLLERAVLNPKTKKYFGFPEYWAPFPVVYRADLWKQIGMASGPSTWDDVLRAAPRLKAGGHPLGFAFSNDIDGNWSLMSLMAAYGSSIQDEAGNVAINSPATVEAVKVGAALYRAGMPADVFTWDAFANNRFMATGQGSMTLNPISALRAVEKQDPDLAAKPSHPFPQVPPPGWACTRGPASTWSGASPATRKRPSSFWSTSLSPIARPSPAASSSTCRLFPDRSPTSPRCSPTNRRSLPASTASSPRPRHGVPTSAIQAVPTPPSTRSSTSTSFPRCSLPLPKAR